MTFTYPGLIYTGEGPEAILLGHGLPLDEVIAAEADILGPLEPKFERVISEVHFAYTPRVKHCSRLDGWGCDQEGEWHGHFYEVKPAAGTAHTLVRHRYVRQDEKSNPVLVEAIVRGDYIDFAAQLRRGVHATWAATDVATALPTLDAWVAHQSNSPY
ncbi:hypothetical protein [Microbacterium sp. 77mftsu3.1]|uniref:hypothetical protein n=1 Tax=Microbacterium sp. 77mftsu3.1 TaxID=1761802 RepID=UPI00036561A9|nr:hypothetical protein [Microbacterium sp. 77mftsu3.1]SDH55080.1 hypothetical protein SAMN04488590_3550 [Microbacterium sp. 77mftsu3.1]